MSNRNQGFTLIELLVVIAIIGVLSSIVFASLSSARTKGYDTAVKSGLANSRSQAELYYNTNLNYSAVCGTANSEDIGEILLGAVKNSADTTQTIDIDAITTATVAVCNDGPNNWASEMPMRGGSYYCVDSGGKIQINAAVGLAAANDYSC